jgi:hypothetical protein
LRSRMPIDEWSMAGFASGGWSDRSHSQLDDWFMFSLLRRLTCTPKSHLSPRPDGSWVLPVLPLRSKESHWSCPTWSCGRIWGGATGRWVLPLLTRVRLLKSYMVVVAWFF